MPEHLDYLEPEKPI